MCPIDYKESEHLALTANSTVGQDAPKRVYDGRYTRIIFSDKAEEKDIKGNIKPVPISYRYNCLQPPKAGIDPLKETYGEIMDLLKCKPEHAKRLRVVLATAWSKAIALANHWYELHDHDDIQIKLPNPTLKKMNSLRQGPIGLSQGVAENEEDDNNAATNDFFDMPWPAIDIGNSILIFVMENSTMANFLRDDRCRVPQVLRFSCYEKSAESEIQQILIDFYNIEVELCPH